MCEYKEDMDNAFRLNQFVLYELFSEQGKVIESLLYSGLWIFLCEVILGRSVDAHFRISYFLKLIPFVLQVEQRNSSLWDFHNS